MTIHSSVRPYLCDICGACFKTKSVQRKHTATLHANPRAHQCPTCHRRFNTAFTLRRHLKSHESDHETITANANAAANTVATTPATSIAVPAIPSDQIAVVAYDESVAIGQENMVMDIAHHDVSHAQKQQEYVQESIVDVDKNTPMQMQVIGGTADDQVVQMIPESLYLQQGSTVQIVTQNEMGGVEQVQMVMIQPGDGNTQIIETGQGTDAETLLYLTSLPNMQTGIEDTG